jgi:isocitrate dehydrogenase
VAFADKLEKACVAAVEAGEMTKDLALLVGPEQAHLTTQGYLAAVKAKLDASL